MGIVSTAVQTQESAPEPVVRDRAETARRIRVVVVMADLQGFSYAEIGTMLDVPVGTVRSRLARGRGLLQRALWEHAVDSGLRAPREPQRRGADDGRG